MKLKDIIAKLLKKEDLTEEEKTFIQDYDPDKASNAIAAAARKDAEGKAAKAEARVKELEGQLEEATKTADDKAKGADDAFKALQKEVAKLTKANEEATAKVARTERASAIHARAKAVGIVRPEGISDAVWDAMLDGAVGKTDAAKQDELDAVLNSFKTDNPHLVASSVKPGANVPGGNPGTGGYLGPNPFSKKSWSLDKQIELDNTNPELAKKLEAQAASET